MLKNEFLEIENNLKNKLWEVEKKIVTNESHLEKICLTLSQHPYRQQFEKDFAKDKKNARRNVIIATLAATGAFSFTYFINNIGFVSIDENLTKLGSFLGLGLNYFRLKTSNKVANNLDLMRQDFYQLIEDKDKTTDHLEKLKFLKHKISIELDKNNAQIILKHDIDQKEPNKALS